MDGIQKKKIKISMIVLFTLNIKFLKMYKKV